MRSSRSEQNRLATSRVGVVDSGKAFGHSFWRRKHLPSHSSPNTRIWQKNSCCKQHATDEGCKKACPDVGCCESASSRRNGWNQGHEAPQGVLCLSSDLDGMSRTAWQNPELVSWTVARHLTTDSADGNICHLTVGQTQGYGKQLAAGNNMKLIKHVKVMPYCWLLRMCFLRSKRLGPCPSLRTDAMFDIST